MGLDVGDFTKSSAFTNFGIEIMLTDKGMDNIDTILEQVFTYIKIVSREGVKKELYDDLSKISKLSFQYKEKTNKVLDEIRSLASNMAVYPVKDVLRGDYLYKNFNEGLISHYLSLMTPNNALFVIAD